MTSKTWSKNDANSSKNGPGGAQNGPKMDPKARKGRSNDQNGTRWRPWVVFLNDGTPFWHIFGSPWGGQKSPKIDIFLKKPSQGALFHRFLVWTSFSSIFRLIFSRFWMKNRWKQTCFFQVPLAFFPTWRPSQNTVFYNTKATFSFSAFLRFF